MDMVRNLVELRTDFLYLRMGLGLAQTQKKPFQWMLLPTLTI